MGRKENKKMDNTKKTYLTFGAGKNEKGEAYALHVEGFVNNTRYMPANGDKKAMLDISVVIGRNPWLLFGEEEAAAEANNPSVNGDKPFVSVVVTGQKADELKDIGKCRIVFCGKAVKRTFTRKDGTPGVSITVYADSLYVLPGKGIDDNAPARKPNGHISVATNVYTRNNQEVTERLVMALAGTVKSVSDVSNVNGRPVVNFDLEIAVPAQKVQALSDGSYQKDADYGKYRVIRCAVWGPRAERMAKVLTVGNQLVVTGTTRCNEFNGNKYINMTCRYLSVLAWVNTAEQPQNGAQPGQNAAPALAAPAAPGYNTPSDDDYGELMDDGLDEDGLPF